MQNNKNNDNNVHRESDDTKLEDWMKAHKVLQCLLLSSYA